MSLHNITLPRLPVTPLFARLNVHVRWCRVEEMRKSVQLRRRRALTTVTIGWEHVNQDSAHCQGFCLLSRPSSETRNKRGTQNKSHPLANARWDQRQSDPLSVNTQNSVIPGKVLRNFELHHKSARHLSRLEGYECEMSRANELSKTVIKSRAAHEFTIWLYFGRKRTRREG